MRRLRFAVVVSVAVSIAALSGAPAVAASDPREISAREAFVAGRYQEALDLFAKLYAETLHPNYLRNIGRCYQSLGDPDKAITSFHDYLRKAKNITPDERKEIEGYIADMEQLKKERESAPKPSEPSHETASAAPLPVPSAPAPATANASISLVAAPASPPSGEETESAPVYKKWWFWTLIGVAVAGGVGAAFATGAFKKTQDAPCRTGYTCQ
jgi:tetratricopeptide (TPR) repeat protein